MLDMLDIKNMEDNVQHQGEGSVKQRCCVHYREKYRKKKKVYIKDEPGLISRL